MGGANVFTRALVAIGCWGLAVAGAPDGSRAAAFPALLTSDQGEPAGVRPHGRNGGQLHRVQNYQGLSIIIDDATGSRVGTPGDLGGPPMDRKNGREWSAPGPGRRLSIDTLRFHGRSLEELRSTLRNLSGRKISRDSSVPGGFILEGSNNDGATTIYVEIRSQGADIRGLSIVHSTRYRAELAQVIEAVKKSFEPFPAARPVVKPPDTPIADGQVPELLKKLAEAEEREREARRQAEAARKEAQDAKERENQARQEEAEKLKRERELAEWKQKVIDDARKKARDELLEVFKQLGVAKDKDKVEPDKGR